MKKTVVLGATTNPSRYAYTCIKRLKEAGHEVVGVGLREGEVDGVKIHKGQPEIEGVHTITLYVGPRNQQPLYDYIVNLKPKRVIFNPGTHNREPIDLLKENGIEVEEACTLIMLSVGNY